MKILQISDTHLFSNDQETLFGVQCNLKLKNVLRQIAENESDVDYIFLTGDISQDETSASYKKAIEYISDLSIPVYWIPGNHDNTNHLENVFKDANHFNRSTSLSIPGWQFIFLNSKLEGSGIGYLDETELKLLRDHLTVSTANNIAIVMHHHAIPVGMPLIDDYILKNRDEFWSIVEGENVKLIMCGHVHGDYQLEYKNIKLEACPATSYQLPKDTLTLQIDKRSGYKVFGFDENTYNARSVIF